MNHAAEGMLQAYLDGEVTGEAAAEVEGHISGCPACRAELDGLRADSRAFSSALSVLDLPLSETAREQALWRVQAAERRPVEAPRRFAFGALSRAAALLLVCAGALAAIPGSPVRELIADLLGGDEPPAAQPELPPTTEVAPTPTPVAEPSRAELPGVLLVPSEGRVRVLVWSVLPGATIRVNLVEGNRVSVEAGSDAEDVRFRTGNGRIEVMNLGHAEAVIQIPRSLPFASLDVDGRQWLFKDGDQLRLSGPVVERATDLVVFRAGD